MAVAIYAKRVNFECSRFRVAMRMSQIAMLLIIILI